MILVHKNMIVLSSCCNCGFIRTKITRFHRARMCLYCWCDAVVPPGENLMCTAVVWHDLPGCIAACVSLSHGGHVCRKDCVRDDFFSIGVNVSGSGIDPNRVEPPASDHRRRSNEIFGQLCFQCRRDGPRPCPDLPARLSEITV